MLNLAIANSPSFFDFAAFEVPRFLCLFAKVLGTHAQASKESVSAALKLVRRGDAKGFETLFDAYSGLVFGYCLRLLKNREMAEDISQDVWVKFAKNIETFKEEASFKTWLLQIARNACFDQLRSLKVAPLQSSEEVAIEDVTQQSVLEILSQQVDKQKVKDCLDQLPDNQRAALLIWMTEDMDYDSIAQEMSLSVSAVKSLLFRAKQSLKEKLEDHG